MIKVQRLQYKKTAMQRGSQSLPAAPGSRSQSAAYLAAGTPNAGNAGSWRATFKRTVLRTVGLGAAPCLPAHVSPAQLCATAVIAYAAASWPAACWAVPTRPPPLCRWLPCHRTVAGTLLLRRCTVTRQELEIMRLRLWALWAY